MGVTVDSPPLEDNNSSVSACLKYLSRSYGNENGTLHGRWHPDRSSSERFHHISMSNLVTETADQRLYLM